MTGSKESETSSRGDSLSSARSQETVSPSGEFLTLSPANRILLERQLELMKEYRDILDVRLELMEGVKPQEP